ncbi:MAG: hypothetical protein K6L76_07950 [Agarilytica sp.]
MRISAFIFLVVYPCMTTAAGFSANFELGALYDSRLALDEPDFTSESSDSALSYSAYGEWKEKVDKNTEVRADFSLFEVRQNEFEEYNLRSLLYGAALVHARWDADLGLEAHHSQTELDGSEFLSITTLNPYYSRFVRESIYMRLGWEHTEKIYVDSSDQDASKNSFSSHFYVFSRDGKNYFLLAYRVENEDAKNSVYDASEHYLRCQWTQKSMWRERSVVSRVGASYEIRKYKNNLEEYGVADEKQVALYVESQLYLSANTYIRLRLEYEDNASDLSDQDYHRHVIESAFGMDF